MEVLVDTGSNFSYIHESLVGKLKLTRVASKRFKFYMGNGQSLICKEKCLGIPLVIQGMQLVVDLLVLPIWGLDIILDMQWLRTLGP